MGWRLRGFWEMNSESPRDGIVEIVWGFSVLIPNIAPAALHILIQLETAAKEGEETKQSHRRRSQGSTMSSSGSWPSGCPEKYPWIGGSERIPPWWEQEMQDNAEASYAQGVCDQENRAPLQEIPQVIPPPPEDPRINQLEEIAMDLTARLFAAEVAAQRKGEEIDRLTALNDEMADRLASLSAHSCTL